MDVLAERAAAPDTTSLPQNRRSRAIGCLLLFWIAQSLAAPMSTAWPRVLACDAVEGIVVIEHRGIAQALIRGQAESSGEWRIHQITADSAVMESTVRKGIRVRAYLASSGRGAIQIDEQAAPNPPAQGLVIVPQRARLSSPEKQ